jgi:N-acetylmuramoyl-L-alanine amidase
MGGVSVTYVVQSGDTLFTISQKFNTTVNTILSVNPQISDPNIILPGQIITIPRDTQDCPFLRKGNRGPAVRRLQLLLQFAGFNPGTIDGIFGPRTQAALLAFQSSLKELEITGVADRETWVALGANCEPLPGEISYTVRPGDTLFIIATRFNVSVEDILRVNPQITDPNMIFTGQVIIIPGK